MKRKLTSFVLEVVPEYSSVLELPNELVIPLNARHRGICRYASNTSDYCLVEAAIKELAGISRDEHSK